MGTIDIAYRRPGRLTITAVDSADQHRHFMLDRSVVLDIGAAPWRDLQQRYARSPLWIDFEKAIECVDSLGDALGIVEPVDAEHEAQPLEALSNFPGEWRTRGIAREPRVSGRLDADRKSADPGLASVHFESQAAPSLGARFRQDVRGEIIAIVLGLKADEIIVCKGAEDLFVVRQCAQNIQRSTGDVQEETDRIEMPSGAQFARQRHQVVVMHPNDIVFSDEGAEPIGEQAIDAHIA